MVELRTFMWNERNRKHVRRHEKYNPGDVTFQRGSSIPRPDLLKHELGLGFLIEIRCVVDIDKDGKTLTSEGG